MSNCLAHHVNEELTVSGPCNYCHCHKGRFTHQHIFSVPLTLLKVADKNLEIPSLKLKRRWFYS